MISPSLPPAVAAALEAVAHGLSRNAASKSAATQSRSYRSGGTSRIIATADDALAYALARMPATYAAVAACLNAAMDIAPDFTPQSVLDCGAGPGTATWTALQAFPSLQSIAMIDANAALRTLALSLATARIDYTLGTLPNAMIDAPSADLVIASYVLNEIGERDRNAFADVLWAKTHARLVVVEPGTPAGYRRIIALRDRLIAQRAYLIAPCPHEAACPLIAPDWCHFAQRLPRSRAHMQLKLASVPFEDEKFSYVVLSRTPPPRRAARVLAQPVVTKADVTTKLCTPLGLEFARTPRRDKTAYRAAKDQTWGDALPGRG